jgi:hypothetical protein
MTENQSAERTAWEVASDPSASEKHWMAACTLLDGKQLSTKKKPHALVKTFVGLPWSFALSSMAGLGAFILFGLISAGMTLPFGCSSILFSGPHAFALIVSLLVGFTTVFKYQQYRWGGGRLWSIVYTGFIAFCGYATFMTEHVYGSLPPILISSVCAFSFIAIPLVVAKMTSKSIALLEGSVGAERVMPHTRLLLTMTGLLYCATRLELAGAVQGIAMLVLCAWAFGTLANSGFLLTRLYKVHDPNAASTLTLATWSPLIVIALTYVPIIAVCSILSLFSLSTPVPLIANLSGLSTLVAIVLVPFATARMAALELRKNAELGLHRGLEKLSHDLKPNCDAERPPLHTVDNQGEVRIAKGF